MDELKLSEGMGCKIVTIKEKDDSYYVSKRHFLFPFNEGHQRWAYSSIIERDQPFKPFVDRRDD